MGDGKDRGLGTVRGLSEMFGKGKGKGKDG